MTNRNVTVMENTNVTLSCKANGNPPPVIKWKREDGQPFLVDNELGFILDSYAFRLVQPWCLLRIPTPFPF
ncbi:hypothetical protein AVEN_75431-1 [Araneus ventricosus]|uniref:Ig-like domain-containing protein n=1 Tax=Araneus ventricosus TaxID=182803 RepID=A0A4Y2W0R8_ARAVE|nr:hypothetical protein AVEN_75431-1 [Araneus ventricosus]